MPRDINSYLEIEINDLQNYFKSLNLKRKRHRVFK